MISNEQVFFIKALSDFLNNEKTVVPDELDMPVLLKLAVEQQCAAILSFQTKLPEFKLAFDTVCFRSVSNNKLLSDIGRAFSDASIQFLIFKGPEIAKYYTRPELRSMGDLDILVHRADREKARQALIDIGCVTDTPVFSDMDWIFYRGKNEIELHHRLLNEDARNGAEIVRFTDTVWENSYPDSSESFLFHLIPEFLFLFSLLHLRKHILWAGCGMRMFLDLGMMIRNCPMDWDCISRKICELSLEKFAGVCFSLIERWFGISAPVPYQQVSDDFFAHSTAEILANGVMGRHNSGWLTLVDNKYANHFFKSDKKFFKRLSIMLTYCFPPYSEMKSRYPELAKSRLLLPVMWLRRFSEAVSRSGMGECFQAATTPVRMNSEKLNSRFSKLREWGIDISVK